VIAPVTSRTVRLATGAIVFVVLLVVLAYGVVRVFDGRDGVSAGAPLAVEPPPPPPVGDRPNPGPGQPDPGFVSGTVIDRSADTIIVQSGASAPTRRIRPAAGVQISFNLTWEGIRTGDQITASGDVGGDGVLVASIVDVNVSQVWGTIAAVPEDGVWIITPDERHTDPTLTRDSSGYVRVRIDQQSTLLNIDGMTIPQSDLRRAGPGWAVAVIGLRAPDHSAVHAKKLLFFVP
jgi:hypothetical protein